MGVQAMGMKTRLETPACSLFHTQTEGWQGPECQSSPRIAVRARAHSHGSAAEVRPANFLPQQTASEDTSMFPCRAGRCGMAA